MFEIALLLIMVQVLKVFSKGPIDVGQVLRAMGQGAVAVNLVKRNP